MEFFVVNTWDDEYCDEIVVFSVGRIPYGFFFTLFNLDFCFMFDRDYNA